MYDWILKGAFRQLTNSFLCGSTFHHRVIARRGIQTAAVLLVHQGFDRSRVFTSVWTLSSNDGFQKKKFPFCFIQRCYVLKETVHAHSMNGTVAFLLSVLLHVYMMKRFPLLSTYCGTYIRPV